MSWSHCLSTHDVLTIFTEEIVDRGGRVTDVYQDCDKLLARSVLPRTSNVRPRDRMHAGVAVKALGAKVTVHPYLFREVCRNGAITAKVLGSRSVTELGFHDREQAVYLLQEAIDACATEDVFDASIYRMRAAGTTDADLAIDLMSHFVRDESAATRRMLREIMDRFFRDADDSRYGLMNAVTSLARDTADPDERWNLEELGGQIGAALDPSPRPQRPSLHRAMPREMVECEPVW